MAHALRKIAAETPSYSDRIRELVEADLVGGARRLLAEALELGVQEEELPAWQKVLAPGKVLGTNSELDPDRSPEFEWLAKHSGEYRRQWVALAANHLLAHSQVLDEVLSNLKGLQLDRRPLLHYID